MSAFVLGVDAGGSNTRAILMDGQGTVLGRGRGGPGTAEHGDVLTSARMIGAACEAALAEAGVASPVTHLAVGAAGVGLAVHRRGVRAALDVLDLASGVTVVTDAEIAHYDAFGPGPGILLIAGTGSVAMGRAVSGEELHRVGGWGGVIGDEGSGYGLGLSALRAVAKATDGRGPRTSLEAILAERSDSTLLSQYLFRMARAPKSEVAVLAPDVAAAAAEGDEVARQIVGEAVSGLLAHVDAIADSLAMESVDVALVGGLIAPGGPLREAVLRGLEERGAHVAPPVDPSRGAARMALDRVGTNDAPAATTSSG